MSIPMHVDMNTHMSAHMSAHMCMHTCFTHVCTHVYIHVCAYGRVGRVFLVRKKKECEKKRARAVHGEGVYRLGV